VSTGRRRAVRWVLLTVTLITGVLVLGTTAYAVHLHFISAALITSAREIRTTGDAQREINAWSKHIGSESWTDSYDEGHATRYFVRVSNRGISRLHLAAWSALTMRVTLRDERLLSVSLEMETPTAPVVVEERFKSGMPDKFYLSYLKAAVPIARLQFFSSIPDTQRRRAFTIRTRCLLVPHLCTSVEDVVPVISNLDLRASPG
jgi:hypothetical protein